ncbi:MAG: hypothetical protein WDZ61_00015 [Parcubacteria group bacterium]
MKWKHPPVIKIYEALGAVADSRVEVEGTSAKVYSSSGNKYYDVSYNPEERAIMANDNGSYWKSYLGYPSIALLMKQRVVSYDKEIASLLAGIAWKDINQQFKNDFDKTLDYILYPLDSESRKKLEAFVNQVDKELRTLNLSKLGKRTKPPEGY